MKKESGERDTISLMSQDSYDSNVLIAAADIRKRLSDSLSENKPFTHDPEDPSAAALKVYLSTMITKLSIFHHINTEPNFL